MNDESVWLAAAEALRSLWEDIPVFLLPLVAPILLVAVVFMMVSYPLKSWFR